MKLTLHGVVLGATIMGLAACDSELRFEFRDEPGAGMLTQVGEAAELERSIKAGFTVIRGDAGTAALGAGVPLNDAAAGDFTGTYTQEQNVDEFDAVKYDGAHLYVAPRRYRHCCFILDTADGAVDGGDPGESIRILATNPVAGTASEQSSIPLEDGVTVQGMYLAQDRMLALTAEAYYGGFGGFWNDIAIWAPERLGYLAYDVSDPAMPAPVAEVSIDGVFVESRRVDNIVYIVSRYTPRIDGIIHNVTTPAQQAHNEALLAGLSIDDLLPKITIDGNEQSLVDPQQCYIPTDENEIGYPVITSVTAVPIDDPTSFTTTCYNDEAYGAYVSEKAIYFTRVVAGASGPETETRIHKFLLDGERLDYRGSADIEGQLWRGGQTDFRMSELDGDLRVIASRYDWNDPDFADHKLFVLRAADGRRELDIVGELPNAEQPQEIGKPNEDLYGVRFLADRAYAVTFERIDPLYVIDLSDPTAPSIEGELEVTGFSDFLHPVSGDLLLGLGSTTMGAVKLELFDVSNLNQPLSRGAVTLGEASYSEARFDRHAFTYQPDVNGVDRFAIPATVETEVGIIGPYETGLYLFEIHDKATPDLSRLLQVGSVHPPVDPTFPFSERNRAFFHDDTIYYVRDEEVWGSFWNAPELVNGPF
ncbi:MAG: beta-propeller domain-containing protein [Pseudomonadota bacterium]